MNHFLRWQLADSELLYWPAFINPLKAAALLRQLLDEGHWQQPAIRIYGREVAIPRRQWWMGDADASYRYSQTLFQPDPWHPAIAAVAAEVGAACGQPFNSVLLNLYRDGADHMGWHSDDEPELGPQPQIASLSLGATRRFLLRHKQLGCRFELPLAAGDLLVMAGDTQCHWSHAVPKEARVQHPRINLTFRTILSPSAHRLVP